MLQLLRLQLSANDFLKALETLKTEVEYLRSHDKADRHAISLYLMDMALLNLVIHDPVAAEKLLAGE